MARIEVPVPAGVSPAAAREAYLLLARNREVLRRISVVLAEQDVSPLPAVLSQLGRVEELWRRVEARWGLLDAVQVTRLTGGNPDKARSHVANLRRRKGVLAVSRAGRWVYPGFQFAGDGTVRAEWVQVARVLAAAEWTPEEIVLWAVAPTGWLDGRIPVAALDDDPVVVLAAAQAVAAGTG